MTQRLDRWLAALAGALALASAAFGIAKPPDTAQSQSLQGRWSLAEIASRPAHASATLPLPWWAVNGQLIEGFDGCNNFSGRLDAPGSIVTTRRGCAGGALKLPLDMADPGPRLRGSTRIGNRLVVPPGVALPGFTMRKIP